MATTTPHQGFPVPEGVDDPDVVGDMTSLALAIEKRVLGVYTTQADRDAKIVSPQDGQFAYVQDVNKVYVYQDSAWVEFPPAQPEITSGSTVPSNATGNDGDVFFKV